MSSRSRENSSGGTKRCRGGDPAKTTLPGRQLLVEVRIRASALRHGLGNRGHDDRAGRVGPEGARDLPPAKSSWTSRGSCLGTRAGHGGGRVARRHECGRSSSSCSDAARGVPVLPAVEVRWGVDAAAGCAQARGATRLRGFDRGESTDLERGCGAPADHMRMVATNGHRLAKMVSRQGWLDSRPDRPAEGALADPPAVRRRGCPRDAPSDNHSAPCRWDPRVLPLDRGPYPNYER